MLSPVCAEVFPHPPSPALEPCRGLSAQTPPATLPRDDPPSRPLHQVGQGLQARSEATGGALKRQGVPWPQAPAFAHPLLQGPGARPVAGPPSPPPEEAESTPPTHHGALTGPEGTEEAGLRPWSSSRAHPSPPAHAGACPKEPDAGNIQSLVALGKGSVLQLRCYQGLLPFLSVTRGTARQ